MDSINVKHPKESKPAYLKYQKVKLVYIKGLRKRKMYENLDKNIGKHGVILDCDSIGSDPSPKVFIYTVRLEDSDIIQVPEEMIELI